jgi:isohexenylglutaconyl-CoA hydratase
MNDSTLPVVQTLRLDVRDQILYITLNRPESRNAMSLQMVTELDAVLDAVATDSTVRALVIRGANQTFCAGGDIKDMVQARMAAASTHNNPDNHADDPFFKLNRRFGDLISKLDKQPQVVIAILEGAVLGGGFGLACVSDVAIAADNAQFGMPETSLGVIPAQIAPFVVIRIGLTQARRLTLLGERFDGQEAARLGLVHYCCPVDKIDEQLDQVLSKLKRCAPQANRVTKALLHQVGHQSMSSLLDTAAAAFSAAVRSEEGSEGTLAFMQKRLPAWASSTDNTTAGSACAQTAPNPSGD